jgi:hypothetical protein
MATSCQVVHDDDDESSTNQLAAATASITSSSFSTEPTPDAVHPRALDGHRGPCSRYRFFTALGRCVA